MGTPAEDTLTGYLLGTMLRTPVIDVGTAVVALIAAIAVVVVALFLCWDLGKQTISDLAKIGWVIIFFILPIMSWIAYWLIIRKG